MSVTVNTFPPFQSMNSPRSWALAIIVLLHVVFLWALTSGLSTRIITALTPPTQMVTIAPQDPVRPPAREIDIDLQRFAAKPVYVPIPDPIPDTEATMDPDRSVTTTSDVGPASADQQRSSTPPVIVRPEIDAKTPLSEPDYPPSEIRLGHAGTVMLSVQVLENGRVGEVRIEQSSGYAKLDAAAAREAHKWRLKPGTQDGRPITMWKTIPLTFQLK